jgi:hypothetical protein
MSAPDEFLREKVQNLIGLAIDNGMDPLDANIVALLAVCESWDADFGRGASTRAIVRMIREMAPQLLVAPRCRHESDH